jgi:hypothetical protein
MTLALGLLMPLAGPGAANAFLAPNCLINGSFHFEKILSQYLVIMNLRGDCQSLRHPGQTVHIKIFAEGVATDLGACSASPFIGGVSLDGEYNYTRPGRPTLITPVTVRLYLGSQRFPGPTSVKYRILHQNTNLTIGRMFLTTRIYSMCPPAGDDTAQGRLQFFSEPGDPLIPII